jgi:NADH-quinone oxidoreductase subunit M
MLPSTIYLSFLGVLVVLLLPAGQAALARWVALGFALAGLSLAILGAAAVPAATGVTTLVDVPWIPWLGIRYHLAVDGISVVLVLLTGLAAVAGVLFSWNIEHRVKDFFAFYLALIGGVYGVFLSYDAFLFLFFYEIAIVPKYFLIAIWGSTRRAYGAMKLALYSFVGSALVLVGLIAAYVMAGAHSFDLTELSRQVYPASFQFWAFPVVFIGFGILAGMWPFHTWAPTGHVAAPTGASMLLAGVVMKLGAYGCLRIALMLFPRGAWDWAWVFSVVAVVGIVYGALIALVQQDFKFVIGYSSVSHMGFVLLGLMSLNALGLAGAVLQMFSHGVIAGLLFGVVGRMVYDRTHTRDLTQLEGFHLHRAMPFAAIVFVLAGCASMGLPGFSGFVAELKVLLGVWQSYPSLVMLSGLGIILAVAYTLRAMQKAFYGQPAPTASPAAAGAHALPPITLAEKAGALLLLGSTVAMGLYPQLLLRWIEPGVADVLRALGRAKP